MAVVPIMLWRQVWKNETVLSAWFVDSPEVAAATSCYTLLIINLMALSQLQRLLKEEEVEAVSRCGRVLRMHTSIQSVLALRRFALRTFIWSAYPPLDSSSEIFRTKSNTANEKRKHMSHFASFPFLFTESNSVIIIFLYFYSICNNLICFRCLCVSFHAVKLLIFNVLLIFRSLGNAAPNYNIALKGNSDSLYEISPYELAPGT
jgi:hypothetical protein